MSDQNVMFKRTGSLVGDLKNFSRPGSKETKHIKRKLLEVVSK